MLTLCDPWTGVPLAILDATLITAARTGAMTAVGARPGRERAPERILPWHRGLAILGIAVGIAILRRAEQADAGTMLRYR